MSKQPRVVLITGPSGSGKNTVVEQIQKTTPGTWYSISATTRAPRSGETHGVDYLYVSEDDFGQLLERGELLEYDTYAGHRYGTPRGPIQQALAQGKHALVVATLEAVSTFRATWPDALVVFIAPPSIEELEHRLNVRNSEPPEALQRRLDAARDEMRTGPGMADLVVINDSVEDAASTIVSRITPPGRSRTSRSHVPQR